METEDIIILTVGSLLFLKFAIIDKIDFYQEQFSTALFQAVHFLTQGTVLLIIFICLLPLLLYLNYRFNLLLFNKLNNRKKSKIELVDKTNEIDNLLEEKLEDATSEELDAFLERVKSHLSFCKENAPFANYIGSLKLKKKHLEQLLEETYHEERLEEIANRKDKLNEEIKELTQQRKEEERKRADYKFKLCQELNIEENVVFKKEELDKEELEVLLEKGYQSVNEYDVKEQRLISVLVKPIMHHSATHTFLVWSLGQLLESIPKVSKITEHDTRDADLTFMYKKETYALEVETGSLLSKKHQLRAKVSYLNRKYPGRWIFVVSNKTLFSKYRKWGPTTQRSEVKEKLKKVLKIDT